MSITRLHVGPRMAQATIHNGVVYLAGQVAKDHSQDAAGQTRDVLATIDRLLAEAGSDKTRILQATIYLKSIADYKAMNAEWDAWVPAGHTPARATVEAGLASAEYLVEILVVAAQN